MRSEVLRISRVVSPSCLKGRSCFSSLRRKRTTALPSAISFFMPAEYLVFSVTLLYGAAAEIANIRGDGSWIDSHGRKRRRRRAG